MPQHYDITSATFDEFVEFMFDREVTLYVENANPASRPWYWDADVRFAPQKTLAFYIRLFSEPEFLLNRYTAPQLEQAFWAIPSCNIDCSVAYLIWDTRLSFEMRESCVRSMYELYARLFAKAPLENSTDMWWDSLAYDWHCGIRLRANGGEDLAMQNVMFETLVRILKLPQEHCQGAALHGLGHLHHPETDMAIQCFLTERPNIDPELKAYALSAAKFEVL